VLAAKRALPTKILNVSSIRIDFFEVVMRTNYVKTFWNEFESQVGKDARVLGGNSNAKRGWSVREKIERSSSVKCYKTKNDKRQVTMRRHYCR
jgi:hypothetical protein